MTVKIESAIDVGTIAQANKLRPTESDFAGKKGFKRRYRKDGSYEWRYRYKPNDHGKVTREGAEVQEMLRPFQRADIERTARDQAKREKVNLRDANGALHAIDAPLADAIARQRGWTHARRSKRHRVERGVDGMLWQLDRVGWRPLGVRCLGTPISGKRTISKIGIQRDPSGNPWRWIAGEWRPTT